MKNIDIEIFKFHIKKNFFSTSSNFYLPVYSSLLERKTGSVIMTIHAGIYVCMYGYWSKYTQIIRCTGKIRKPIKTRNLNCDDSDTLSKEEQPIITYVWAYRYMQIHSQPSWNIETMNTLAKLIITINK